MNSRALLAATITFFISLPSFANPRELESDQPTATVLCYHIVEAPADPRMEIGREEFRQHLQYLEMTGYNVIPLRHLFEYVTGKRATIPRNAVVITLDDGWRSTYTEAFPELQKRGFPFTVFIYPNIIGKTANSLTWDQVKAMADAGVDIESHTFNHPFLTRRRHASMTDATYAEWLEHELSDSRKTIEKHTGRRVRYLAYPYGDYDHRVAASVGHAGYDAALTCEFGRVKRGSDPLRMKRFVIDKRMDFAAFRGYMGASQLQLAQMTPLPNQPVEPTQAVISAKIPDFKSLDPKSVGLALLTLGSTLPYSYDPQTGDISLVLPDAVAELKGKYHRAVVWATNRKTGKRVEATWVFRLPDMLDPNHPQPEIVRPVTPVAAQLIPASGGRPGAIRENRGELHRAPK